LASIEDLIEADSTLNDGAKAFLIDTLWLLRRSTERERQLTGADLVMEWMREKQHLAIAEDAVKDIRILRLRRAHVDHLQRSVETALRA
jgi:hypothetical protein